MRQINNPENREIRDALSQEWASYFGKFFPKVTLVPIFNNASQAAKMIKDLKIQGIILSGGESWGESINRDKTEKKIIEYCVKNNLPILGVCRGLQVLNKVFGGKIEKDIKVISKENHVKVTHMVCLDKNYKKIIGKENILVNSFHNQGVIVKNISKEFNIFAKTDNEVVEGMCHKTKKIMAIQWHPERKTPSLLFDQMLIKKIFKL